MVDISIHTKPRDDGWVFTVEVKEGLGKTTHEVVMSKSDYERISKGKFSPEDLVKKSFEFLLKREPKESILSSFDITVINRYFPEYEEVISR